MRAHSAAQPVTYVSFWLLIQCPWPNSCYPTLQEARLGLQPGLERNGLAVLNDGKVLQECVTKVLEELGISPLVTPPGASFEETGEAV